MKISILSVPGLPNAVSSLDSKLYHDYESILKVIEDIFPDAHFEVSEYVWPREVSKQEVDWSQQVPGLAIPVYYLYYNLDKEYQREIVDEAKRRILECAASGELLFLILHSHGNRVAFDALLELKREGLLQGMRIVALCFAPAYRNVMNGMIPPGITKEELLQIEEAAELLLSFRMRSDFLSGDPEIDNAHFFDPNFYELGWVGHSTIRNREDVMDVLGEELRLHFKK